MRSHGWKFLALGIGIACLLAAAGGDEESPHAEALRLLFQNQRGAIRQVDQATTWWHDVEERVWVVRRPFMPGIHDTTHWFDVTYRIGGRDVARWWIDTREKRINRASKVSQEREHEGFRHESTDLATDLGLLRNRVIVTPANGPWEMYSSEEAIRAAARVFDRLHLVGMSRETFLWTVGHPATIFVNATQPKGVDAPLVYEFRGVRRGTRYVVGFEAGKVKGVRRETI